MIPPTLLREFANSRPPKEKGKAKDRDGVRQPYLQNRPTSEASSNSRSPSAAINSPSPFWHHTTRPGSSSDSRLDPPPVYERTPQTPPVQDISNSSPHSSYFQSRPTSPVSSPQLRNEVLSLPPQSRPAAGPHGRSILQQPRDREPAVYEPSATDGGSQESSQPQSRSNPRVRPEGAPQVVRFNAGAVESSATANDSFTRNGRPRGSSDVEMPSSSMYNGPNFSSSAPGSRRSSLDLLSHAIETIGISGGGGQGWTDRSAKSKTKAKNGINGASGSSPGSKSPPLGLKKPGGLKNILTVRRKDDSAKPSNAALGGHASAVEPLSPPETPAASSSSSSSSSLAHATPRRSTGSNLPRRSADASTTALQHQPPAFHAPPPDSREFKKGTYTYSISLPLPANLPPTLYADFGRNTYTLKAVVKRPGPLTPNLSCEREVVMVHAPDEEGTEETEAIIVERSWEDSLTYRVFISGRSFACGAKIPLWMKFIPLGEKVRLWRFTAVLEEKTHYYAKERKVARHESPRKWHLLKLVGEEGKPLVPIISDQPDAMRKSPLAEYALAAAGFRLPEGTREMNVCNGSSSARGAQRTPGSPSASVLRVDDESGEEEDGEAHQDALASLLDPAGPWELSVDLQLPGAATKMNISTDHVKSTITVHHLLRLTFRVERASGVRDADGKPKLFDIVIECPISINHSRTSDTWLSLPNYWSVAGDGSPGASCTPTIEEEADSYFVPRRPRFPGASPSGDVSPSAGGSSSSRSHELRRRAGDSGPPLRVRQNGDQERGGPRGPPPHTASSAGLLTSARTLSPSAPGGRSGDPDMTVSPPSSPTATTPAGAVNPASSTAASQWMHLSLEPSGATPEVVRSLQSRADGQTSPTMPLAPAAAASAADDFTLSRSMLNQPVGPSMRPQGGAGLPHIDPAPQDGVTSTSGGHSTARPDARADLPPPYS